MCFVIRLYKCLFSRKSVSLVKYLTMDPVSDPVVFLRPPESVRAMKTLDRGAFIMQVRVPFITLKKDSDISSILKKIQKYLLRVPNLKPVEEDNNTKKVLIDPDVLLQDKKKEEVIETLRQMDSESSIPWFPDSLFPGLRTTALTLTYENFTSEEILKAILPCEEDGCSGYSAIGHIIHLNVRDHLTDYKYLIGQVLLDKSNGRASVVVNKTCPIESEFRNFQMEILAGEKLDTIVQVKENGCIFKFDFAHVFWNPRLSTEHERVVKLMSPNAVVFDVFAGVGPFSVLAAKKFRNRCSVFANDLNPHSYEWLKHNAKLNKVESLIQTFQMDGRAFIKEVVKPELLKIWKTPKETDEKPTYPGDANIHVIMNLPAIGIEFLDAFLGLYHETDINPLILPKIHGYCFMKTDENIPEKEFPDLVIKRIQEVLKMKRKLEDINISVVRRVARTKLMMRATFDLPKEVLFMKLKRPLESEGESQISKKAL